MQVPRQTPARDLAVRLDPHEVSIVQKHTGDVYLQGRLWRGIVPLESVWTQGNGNGEDGCLLLLRKMNLELLTKHAHALHGPPAVCMHSRCTSILHSWPQGLADSNVS